MGRLRRGCIYYIGGALLLWVATPVQATLFEKPGEVAAAQTQARQTAAHVLSQAYQLSGMKALTANLAHRYVNEALSQKMSGWVGEAIAQVLAERKGPTLSQKVNDPQLRAEMQARIAARLRDEIPKLAKAIVYERMFQGLLNDADPAAQKMVGHIVDAMTQPLNTQVDVWAQQLYGKAMEKLDPYIKKQVQIGRATIALSATDIRGTIDGAMRLQTVTDMISGPLSEAMGESAFGEMQTRLSDFLNGKLPPELESALYKGPDAVDAVIAKGETYLPTAQLDALKAKVLALPLLTIPNEVYGGMLAGSAARHFVLAFAAFPDVNLYELQRGTEVTNVMIWQLKTKQGFNMSLGQLLDVAGAALGQAGGLARLGRVGKTIAEAKDKFEAVEKKVKTVEDKIKNPIEKASTEFRAQVDELAQALKDFQEDLAAPLNEWRTGVDLGLKDGAAQIKALLPEGFNGIPGTWEELQKKLGLPDKPFGKLGDKSVLDAIGASGAAKKVNAALSDTLAQYLVDGAQALLPAPEITPEEKVPAQNPDEAGDYDPVLLHNGEFTHPVVDVSIPGRGLDFQFKRIYRSRSQFLGRLGWNWTHNFEESLRTWASPQGVGLTWIDVNGRKFFFKARTDFPGEFVAPSGVFAELKTIVRGEVKGFALRERGGFITRFDHAGFLQEKCDRFGNCLRCERDASGTLQAVVDTVGRRMQLSYDGVGRLTQLKDNSGRVWTYDYDARGDLTRVVSPATDLFPQGITTGYMYDAHRLVQIRDPKGNLFLKNVYGTAGFARGQVIAQHYGAPENVVKSRYVLLRPAWLVTHWPDALNVAIDRVDLRDRRGVVKRFWHNANGNLLRHEIVDARGKTHPGMRYTYNGDGLRVKEVRPLGLVRETTYYQGAERTLQGLSIHTVLGGVRHNDFSYDSKFGDLILEKSPDGVTKEWRYGPQGNLLTLTLSQGERELITKYRHNNHGQRVAVEDPRGTVTEYTYDDANRTSIVRDARGRKLTTHYTHDAVGNITAITSPNGGVRKLEVDAQNLIRREVTPLGYERRYEYDPHGNVTTMQVGALVYRFDYDLLDRLVTQHEPNHIDTHYSYDADGRLSAVIFPEGNQLRVTYDAWGHLTVIERGAGTRDASFTQYHYDADGNRVGVVDGLGHLTELARNAFGEVVAELYPNGTRMEWDRDDTGKVVARRARDQSGAILSESRIQTDSLGLWQRISEWDSAGNTWRSRESHYDPDGNLVSATNPQGDTTHYDYDALGNRTRTRYPEAISEAWHYNELGLPLLYKAPSLAITRFSYDLQGRLTARTDPNNAITRYSYDDRDNLLDEVLPEGAPLQYAYDGLGRRTSVTQANRVTRYDWDGNGRLRALMDPLGVTTRYTYDGVDRRTSERFPDGGVTTMSYDANSQVTKRCLPNGNCVAQDYDEMGNVVSRRVKHLRQCFQYDPLGRMVSAQEGVEVARFVYSSLSAVVESVQGTGRLKKTYDANGQRTGMQYPDGSSVQWRRDGLGRITQVEGPGGFHVTQTWGMSGPEKIQYGNGRSDAMTYDAMGNIATVTPALSRGPGRMSVQARHDEVETPPNIRYTYNLLGNLISQDSTHYRYDPGQQLIQAGSEQWRYTLNGERAQAPELKFDKNGNMTSDGRHEYIYDALDRLEEVWDENKRPMARYTYDALNRRMAKEVSGHTTQYVYDGWEPVEILEDGERAHQFVRGDALDDAFGEVGPRYYHKDRLGSVTAVSDASGKTVGQYGYDAFGIPSVIRRFAKDLTVDSSASPQNDRPPPRGYTGQLHDAETGLTYMRNRYYSPQLGQFLTRDPLGYKNNFHAPSTLAPPFNFSFHQYLGSAPRASLANHVATSVMDTNLFATIPTRHNGTSVETNLHMYVGNNPLNATDPLGLYAMTINRSLGWMKLYDQGGAFIQEWQARTFGQHRAREVQYGDTPNGIYKVTSADGGEDFRHVGHVNGRTIDPVAYGLGYIGLKPLQLEPGTSGRSGIAIHGGGSSLKQPFDQHQGWANTLGCVRMQNGDIMQLVDQIHALENRGDRDGTLTVYDYVYGDALQTLEQRGFLDKIRPDRPVLSAADANDHILQ